MQTDKKSPQREIVHKTLEQRSLDYWRVSSVWNGRGGIMQVGEALAITYNIAMTSNPHSPLAARARELESEIIHKQQD